MTAAVRAAPQPLARPGDVVLLAPAAASMDQFADYAAPRPARSPPRSGRWRGGDGA